VTLRIKVKFQVFFTIPRTTLRQARPENCRQLTLFRSCSGTQYQLKWRHKRRK